MTDAPGGQHPEPARAQPPAEADAAPAGGGRVVYGRPSTLELPALTLDRDEALGYVGYAGQLMDEQLRERFEALAQSCERKLRPAAVWALYELDERRTRRACEARTPEVALTGCALTLPGRDIARHLEGAREVALMACTLGAASERELRALGARSAVDELLFGACASALVEAAGNAAEARIVAAAAERGLRTNWRFSPGYGDLPLSIQPQFIRTLDATRRIGVVVNSGGLMVPTKSITAVVGLFDADADAAGAQAEVRTRCSVCQLAGCCELRKRGTTCHG